MRVGWKNLGIFITLILLSGLNAPYAMAKKHWHHRNHTYQPPSTRLISGKQNLSTEIDRIINGTNPNLNIGVQVKSMTYGDTLYNRNEQRSFVPASIIKIFTAESALLLLGPNYKFPTSFVTNAKTVNGGILNGNLYLVLTGDPSLTYYDLEDLMASLKSQHIQQINGNVYIDSTAYDQEIYGPGWVWNDKRFCYAAPISASIINHNCLTFQVKPGKLGHSANIVDSTGYVNPSIQNNVLTRSSASSACRIRLGPGENNAIVVSGCMPKGRIQGVSSVITDVMYYNKALVTRLLSRYGVRVNGAITTGAAPSKPTVLAVHESSPLHNLITQMLKKSDNIIAGSLFKKVGEVYTKQPGSWENGSSAVTRILSTQMGVNTWRINITDGSGLSRYNLITPAQMIRVLDFAFHHHGTNYEFISALPVAGVDGTLKHRLYNVAWKVRAKTGTMTGVVALAGYAINRDKEPLAFVIIVNGRMGLGWKYKGIEDQIVTALTRYTR